MAFHQKSTNTGITFSNLNFRDGTINVAMSTENGTRVNQAVESVSGFVTKIDTRKKNSEYGESESMSIYFHDQTCLAFNYANNGLISYKAAHLVARMLSVAKANNGFANEIHIRAGSFPVGHRFPDGTVLTEERSWTSLRAPALSDQPLPPFYGNDTQGNPLPSLPETPPVLDQTGNPIMHQGKPIPDHTNLKLWVEGAIGFLKSKVDEVSEVNRQRATQSSAQVDQAGGIDPAVLAAAELAANQSQSEPPPVQRAQTVRF